MCKKCEAKCLEKGCVEVTKELIYLSADHPSESIFQCESTEVTVDNTPSVVLDANGESYERVCIKSNVSFGYSITVRNCCKHDIHVVSVVDPLLTINNCCGSGCTFINFCKPAYSEHCVELNCRYKRNGELVDGCIKICPGKVGVFTIRGVCNSRKLSVRNFAFVRYKLCGSDNEHLVRSENESFCLENNFEGVIVTNNGDGPAPVVVNPVIDVPISLTPP
jgi:hypothetical protein